MTDNSDAARIKGCPPSLMARLKHDRFPKNPKGGFVCVIWPDEMEWIKAAAGATSVTRTPQDAGRQPDAPIEGLAEAVEYFEHRTLVDDWGKPVREQHLEVLKRAAKARMGERS